MLRLAFVSAVSLSLLAPAARADDTPGDRREQALEQRERNQEQRERSFDRRARLDDQRDLARIESQAARLETMRTNRAPAWAVAALDADVERELASERLEGRAELRRDDQEVRRSQEQVDANRRQGPGDLRPSETRMDPGARQERREDRQEDRRALADDVRDQQAEAAQGERIEALRREWAALRGQYGRPGLDRRRALLAELVTLARAELAGDRQERHEDRQGRR